MTDQLPGQIALSALMDNFYGAGCWTQYDGTAGSGSDIGPALTVGLQNLRATYGSGIVWIDPSMHYWALKSSISPGDLSGIYLVGAGSQASVVVYQKASGVAFQWSGANALGGIQGGGGMRGVGVLLDSGLGNTNAMAILSQGNSTRQADQCEFDDIYISAVGASSYWFNGVEFYGVARTSPQGIRIGSINNMQIFNCCNSAFFGENMDGWTITGLGSFTGQGGGNDVYITGDGSQLTDSVLVTLQGLTCNGTLHLTNTSLINISGSTQSLAISNVDHAHGFLNVSGTVSGTFGASSHVFVN